MIKLGADQKLFGRAGVSSAISYTLSGEEIVTGNASSKILAQGILVPTVTMLYTAPANKTITITDIFLYNNTAHEVIDIKFFINQSNSQYQITKINIPANGTAILNSVGWLIYDHTGLRVSSGSSSGNNYFP